MQLAKYANGYTLLYERDLFVYVCFHYDFDIYLDILAAAYLKKKIKHFENYNWL